MKLSLDKRRQHAALDLINSIGDIADQYDLCPSCLAMVVLGAVREQLHGGEIEHILERHHGDEGLPGETTQ